MFFGGCGLGVMRHKERPFVSGFIFFKKLYLKY